MLSAPCYILKKDAASVVWVEAVQNLETAILRAEKLLLNLSEST
ncbi:MAG TPA: hypothetical protein VIH67_13445 [Candidatus Acidoferrum sp.]